MCSSNHSPCHIVEPRDGKGEKNPFGRSAHMLHKEHKTANEGANKKKKGKPRKNYDIYEKRDGVKVKHPEEGKLENLKFVHTASASLYFSTHSDALLF